MKRIIPILLIAATSFGLAGKVLRPSAGSPLTTSYATSSVQMANGLGVSKNVLINNTTSSEIACDINHNTDQSIPVDTMTLASEAIVVPASTALVLDNVYPQKQIFCRSNSGSNITSGAVYLQVW